jgi:hypothetical protein
MRVSDQVGQHRLKVPQMNVLPFSKGKVLWFVQDMTHEGKDLLDYIVVLYRSVEYKPALFQKSSCRGV